MAAAAPEALRVRLIPLERLRPAAWNANRVPPDTLAKIRRSLQTFGIVENLVVRPHPDHPGDYEILSGNHRHGLYGDLGVRKVPCHVVDVDDAHARILAQTLNRTRGADDPEAYAALVYDSFAGSGTAIIAGEITGRPAFAMEIDPAFCDVARQRYADFTDQPELAP